ncbi:hypothetical protein ACFL67_00325 [candidate division KSB1 bacterium]
MKNSPKIFILIIVPTILMLCAAVSAKSQPMSWRSYTSFGSVRDIVCISDDIWAATGGGLFRYNSATGQFLLLNNTAGLTGIDLGSLAVDESGILWTGMDDGTLNYIRLDDTLIRNVIIDTDPLQINDIVYYENAIYLAFDFGISLFLIDKKEVNSTFRALGSFPMNSSVQKLFIHNGILWASTEHGLASADLTAPNLQDPQYWDNYTNADGLSGSVFKSFASKGDKLFVATNDGVSRLENERFVSEGLISDRISDIEVYNGDIYAAGIAYIYKYIGAGGWEIFGQEMWNINVLKSDGAGNFWAGHDKKGLFRYNESTEQWDNYFPNSPGGNTFESMVIDRKGWFWAATGQSAHNGIYMFDGDDWTHFTTDDSLSGNNSTGIAEAPDGSIWAGSPGQGINIISESGNEYEVTHFDTTDNRLSGAVSADFVVIPVIKRDIYDNMWILNKFAASGNAIAVVTPQSEWHYFSVNDGLVGSRVVDLAIDESDQVWIATDDKGVSRLNYNGTLGDKSDDYWETYNTSDKLSSNRCTGVVVEEGNGVWIATEDGINHIIEGFLVQEIPGAISTFITHAEVDPAHNKWFATPKGLSILANDDFTWSHYSAENSPLVANEILKILFHPETGTAYIGTSAGLSVVTTPYKLAPGNASNVSVYPNPFIVESSNDFLVIENLPLNSTVKIFTITGRLVQELLPGNGVYGSQAFWDGTDTSGNTVPSGVYLIAAGTSISSSKAIKLAVIRK